MRPAHGGLLSSQPVWAPFRPPEATAEQRSGTTASIWICVDPRIHGSLHFRTDDHHRTEDVMGRQH